MEDEDDEDKSLPLLVPIVILRLELTIRLRGRRASATQPPECNHLPDQHPGSPNTGESSKGKDC